jgi:hypothetical protein
MGYMLLRINDLDRKRSEIDLKGQPRSLKAGSYLFDAKQCTF